MARNSRLEGRIDRPRFLTAEVALFVAHRRIVFNDARSRDANKRTRYTRTAQKIDGAWIFVAYQNTPLGRHERPVSTRRPDGWRRRQPDGAPKKRRSRVRLIPWQYWAVGGWEAGVGGESLRSSPDRRTAMPPSGAVTMPRKPEYFAIVGAGRSGSTMLVDLLNSHPKIICLGEEVSPHGRYGAFPDMDVSHFIRHELFDNPPRVRGFKMPWQWTRQYPGVWDAFHELRFKLVLSRRENYLEQLVSATRARVNRDWSSSQPYARQSVSLDPAAVIPIMTSYQEVETSTRTQAAGLDLSEITYESLVAGKRRKALQRFLGVKPAPLATATVKAGRLPLPEAIENYAEIRDQPRGTAWGACLPAEETVGSRPKP